MVFIVAGSVSASAMFRRLLIPCLLFVPLLALAQRPSALDVDGANDMVTLINQERAQNGLPPLAVDSLLIRAAERHTELMVEKGELTHKLATEPDLRERISTTGLNFEIAGENVAYDANVQHAHTEFMHSPGHRANILNPKFNAVGIAVIHSGNLIWVTEDFAQRLGITSASEAANIVESKYRQMRKAAGSPAAKEQVAPEFGRLACDMAKEDRVETESARQIPNVRGVMAWTSADPAKLPAQVKKLADDRAATHYSLGVCFASSASYPSKVFWIVMAIY